MRIVLKHLNNFRDLGNFQTKDNQRTKSLTFFRGEAPTELTREEIQKILDLNIKTVIDLRTKFEIDHAPDKLNIDGVNYHNISILPTKYPEIELDVPGWYMRILANADKMKEVFEVILKAKGNIFFHCTAGKDRTGLVAMLLLMLADCYDADIVADYEVSYTFLKYKIFKDKEKYPEIRKLFDESKAEYMEKTLKMFKEKYGNVYDYFKHLGFTDDEINKIKSKIK